MAGPFDDIFPPSPDPQDRDSGLTLSDLITGEKHDPDALPAESRTGLLENAAAPVTDLYGHYKQIESERRAELNAALDKVTAGGTTWDSLKAGGIAALDGINYMWTPISALERSFVSAPLERTTGLPHGMTEMGLDVLAPFAGDAKLGKAVIGGLREKALAAPEHVFVKPFVEALSPGAVDATASLARTAAITHWSEHAARVEQAHEQLDQYVKFMDRLPEDERLQFMYRHERGMRHGNETLDAASRTIGEMFSDRVEQVRALGEGYLETVIEHYFPHMWEDPVKAADLFAQQYAKSPLLGSRSFLHERVHTYISDGLAAGLKLADANPINAVLLKVREMDRFILGKQLVERLKGEGLLEHFKPGQIKRGWVAIEDPVARVRQWSEEERGFVDRGQYAAPEGAARVINNSLGKSWLRDKGWFKAIRGAGNALNMLQLGLSGFHAGFTTIDSGTSKLALAIKQLQRGDILKGAGSLLEVPISPITSFVRGQRLIKAYRNPMAATEEMRSMVDSMVMAGGRIRMPKVYGASERGSLLEPIKDDAVALWKATPHGKFTEALKQSQVLAQVTDAFKNHGILGGAFHTAGRIAQTTSAWMMEGLVPRMKAGVFYDMVKDSLGANPGMSMREYERLVQKHWASVDNRMGEMVYDNLMWNKTGKDLAHIMVRSVGWNLGTFRELGGGVADSVKLIDAIVRGDKAEFTDRMAYTIALPIMVGTLGGMTNYLLTGEPPQELKDYFFPRTGKTTKYGTPDRLSLPSYMKDIYEYTHDAPQTLINKAHPMIPMVHQMLTHHDFYGYPISPTDHQDWNLVLMDYIKFLGKGSLPFSVQGIMKQADKEDGMARYLSLIGLTPAPGYITSPDQMAQLARKREEALSKRKAKKEAAAQ